MKTRALITGMVVVSASMASASLTNYTDESIWASDAGTYSTVDFVAVPVGAIDAYYAGQGVTFEADDEAVELAFTFVDSKGAYSASNGLVVSFATPQYWVGTTFPGGNRFSLYSGTTLVGVSDDFGGTGGGHFGGVWSTQSFDKVVIDDWFDLQTGQNNVYIDNLYFSDSPAPVPEPASMVALGLGAVALVRRRRK
ncbi:MAG: PEP-CTERM sorting domain-containing protein [Fimbriimonas sp.]